MVQLMQQFEVRHCLSPKRHYYHLIYFLRGLLLYYIKHCKRISLWLVRGFDQRFSCFLFLVFCLQVWRELFSPLHALSFGIGGDTTCNVLWRLQNGELENIRPKVSLQERPISANKHYAEIKPIRLCSIVLSTKTIKVVIRKNEWVKQRAEIELEERWRSCALVSN